MTGNIGTPLGKRMRISPKNYAFLKKQHCKQSLGREPFSPVCTSCSVSMCSVLKRSVVTQQMRAGGLFRSVCLSRRPRSRSGKHVHLEGLDVSKRQIKVSKTTRCLKKTSAVGVGEKSAKDRMKPKQAVLMCPIFHLSFI